MTNWALIVGINEYKGLPNNTLFGAVADAVDFAEWALHPDGGAVDPAQFFMWTYPPPAADSNGPLGLMSRSANWARGAAAPSPTRAPAVVDIVAMVEALENEIATSASSNRIYVFFAGHGTQVAGKDGETCFVVGDFEDVGNLGIIPCDSLRFSLESTGFAPVVMFLDCCRSPFKLQAKAPNIFPEGVGDDQFHAIGRATQRGQQAFEYPPQPPKRGAFTKAVAEGLRRWRDADNHLTLPALAEYVRGRVDGLLGVGKQSPSFESEPNPWGDPLVSGPPIEILASIVVTGATPGAQLQLYDSNNAPFGAPVAAPADGGQVRFPPVATANSYSVGVVGGDILKSFRHPGPDDTDVPLDGGADVVL